MKKLFLLAAMLAAVLSGGGAGAQNSVITHRIDSADNIQSTLICEYIYPQTIACYNTEDRMTVFVLDTQSNQTISVKLKGYYIRDIAINDTKDTLFFCGYKFDYRQQGIFGFFNIHDVFFGSGYIHIHDYFYSNGNNNNYVKDLTRMVFYRRQNVHPYVACIGRTYDNYPCLVDVEIRPMGGYTSGYINNHDEKFTDIKFISTHKNFDTIHCISNFRPKEYERKGIPLFIDCPRTDGQEEQE